MYHETFPGISYSGSEMTCIVDDNGDYYMYMYTLRDDLKLRTCSLDITEDAHGGGGGGGGGIKTSQTTLRRNLGEKMGGACFQRGRISRRLRYITVWLLNCEGPTKILTALSRLHDV